MSGKSGDRPSVRGGIIEATNGSSGQVTVLVRAMYPALAAGDAEALFRLLSEDFVGVFSEGLPAPIGGAHRGREATIRDGWWAIGRRFQVRAEPLAWYPIDGERLVVTGRYLGRHRRDDVVIDASFAHIWVAAGSQLVSLQQITDTVAWGLGPDHQPPEQRTTDG